MSDTDTLLSAFLRVMSLCMLFLICLLVRCGLFFFFFFLNNKHMIMDFLTEVGRRLSAATGDERETAFLFQRISVALQRFNAVLIHESIVAHDVEPGLAIPTCVLASVFSPLAFYTIGQIIIIIIIIIFPPAALC